MSSNFTEINLRVEVNPEYHPKIIGRGGAVISKIRDDFDVQIQIPRKEAEEQSIITITGYEKQANEARNAILKIVGEFESMVHEEVSMFLILSVNFSSVQFVA